LSRSVVVIGAGISGLCCADALQRRGYDVTVLDADGAEQGCSYGNGGIIVPSHFVSVASAAMIRLGIRSLINPRGPFGFSEVPDMEALSWIGNFVRAANPRQVAAAAPLLRDLNLAGKRGYEELIERLGIDAGFESKGLLMLCANQNTFEEEAGLAQQAEALGLKTSVMVPADARELEPTIGDYLYGAVHFKDDAHLTPPVLMRALRQWLQLQGVSFFEHSVTGFEVEDRMIKAALTERGELAADEFVLAAGVWSGALAAKLNIRLPMLSGKGYGFTLPTQIIQPSIPAILVEARVAVTPMLDGTRFVGVMELGKPNDQTNWARVAEMRSQISNYYQHLQIPERDERPVWHGHRPCSPDGLPYIGRSAKYENLAVATGHGMMGMSMGPSTGELIGQILGGEPTLSDVQLLSPNRYDLP
jgi:D-amino-acid dehydrogenase